MTEMPYVVRGTLINNTKTGEGRNLAGPHEGIIAAATVVAEQVRDDVAVLLQGEYEIFDTIDNRVVYKVKVGGL